MQAVLAAKAPTSAARGDPFGELIRSSRQHSESTKLGRQRDSKYNPLPSLWAAEAPTGGSDLVGDLIRGLKSADPHRIPGTALLQMQRVFGHPAFMWLTLHLAQSACIPKAKVKASAIIEQVS